MLSIDSWSLRIKSWKLNETLRMFEVSYLERTQHIKTRWLDKVMYRTTKNKFFQTSNRFDWISRLFSKFSQQSADQRLISLIDFNSIPFPYSGELCDYFWIIYPTERFLPNFFKNLSVNLDFDFKSAMSSEQFSKPHDSNSFIRMV